MKYNWKYWNSSVDDEYRINPIYWRWLEPFYRWGFFRGLWYIIKNDWYRLKTWIKYHNEPWYD